MKITHFNPSFPTEEGIAQGSDQSIAIYHEYYLHGERIRPMELEDIGYRLTGRHVVIGDKYKLFELLPIDSAFRASHSFLAPNHRVSGVVIKRTFNEHKAEINPVTAQARYAARAANGRVSTGLTAALREAM
jgi:hypothetical protein